MSMGNRKITFPTKCARTPHGTGAECGSDSEYVPILHLSPNGKHYTEIVIGIAVCQKHKESILWDDIVSEEGWRMLCNVFALQHLAPPSRKLSHLEFKKLDDPTLDVWKAVPDAAS